MKKREISSLFLHLGVGLSLALAAAWNYWMMVPATFIYAWLREQAQHRYELDADNVATKTTFFRWMTWHSMFEVLQWTLGAAIGCGVWYFIH